MNDSGGTNSSKTVQLEYEDYYDEPNQLLADPTHVTSIIEPADGEGSSAATTALTYVHEGDGRGELAAVTDAGGVPTTYTLSTTLLRLVRTEGIAASSDPNDDYRVVEIFDRDARGNLTSNEGYNGEANFSHQSCFGSASMAPATGMTCLAGSIATGVPSDPPDAHMPLAECCEPIDMPTCGVQDPEYSCGEACYNQMFDMTRFIWPTRSVLEPGSGELETSFEKSARTFHWGYDELSRLTSAQSLTTVPVPEENPTMGPAIERTFTLTPDQNGNVDFLTDPDGSGIDYVYDDANRLKQIWVDGVLIVEYTLYPTGRPQYADYANGIRTEWTYDAAQRLDKVRHTDGATLLLELDYGYSPDGLVTSIAQSDALDSETIEYEYDKRGRLIREWGALLVGGGTGLSTAVDLSYTYDQVGNRLTRTDASVSPSKVTTYYYDVHDSNWGTVYGSFNNRLMKYETVQGSTTLERAWYAYNRGGHVKRMVKEYPNSPPSGRSSGIYYVTCMQYNIDAHLWLLKQMEKTISTGAITTTRIREFRYDGDSRRRFLVRERDPDTFLPISNTWREYLGSNIHAELEVDEENGTAEATRRYLHGYGLVGWQDTSTQAWHFVQPDMLGSTRLVTDGSGDVATGLSYMAFGEIADQTNPDGNAALSRYDYCGSWGYENDDFEDTSHPAGPTGLLHVGARYYAAAQGRFLQRDPLGIGGGLNTYAYAHNRPLTLVDPSGLFSLGEAVSVAGQSAHSSQRQGSLLVALASLPETRRLKRLARSWSIPARHFVFRLWRDRRGGRRLGAWSAVSADLHREHSAASLGAGTLPISINLRRGGWDVANRSEVMVPHDWEVLALGGLLSTRGGSAWTRLSGPPCGLRPQ